MKAKELLKPGDLFEKYQVESLLGHGGMGAVYKVRHSLLDTSFAIKVLFPEVADQNKKFIGRFLREARLAGKIRHENLIAVYDAGQNRKTRLYYIVMEYISGGTLRARLRKEHRLTSADAIKIITGIAQALEKAFEYNIVHRDIKPDNIMFAENGTVKLADLGIAKAVDPQDTTLTLEQSVFGTPAYMSPEQARDSHMVDCRADIYSLGIVFYEMLAGRRPYSGSSTIELLSQIIDNKEVPDIRAVNSSVGDPLAELIRSMMAKDPAERPQTPAELLQRLRSPEIQSQKQFPIAASLPGEADSPEETVRCGTRPMFVNKIPLVKDLDPADNRKTTNPPTHPEPSGKETSLDPDAEIPAGEADPCTQVAPAGTWRMPSVSILKELTAETAIIGEDDGCKTVSDGEQTVKFAPSGQLKTGGNGVSLPLKTIMVWSSEETADDPAKGQYLMWSATSSTSTPRIAKASKEAGHMIRCVRDK